MPENCQWEHHVGPVLDSVKDFNVIECESCGFKHVVPLPTAEETAQYYSEQFLAKRPGYFDSIREDLEWWRMVYAEQYTLFEKYLPAKRRRILDVGCGSGFFLQLGKERSWETLGIEPSRQASEHARELGLEVVNDVFGEEQARSLGTFDVVHMHEVLEHIHDPVDMLRLARQLLKPHGLLCVVAPNDYNPLQNMLREQLGFKPWWVSPPVHINYFTFDSLERLVRSLGFQVLLKTATFPMELFLLMGENYVGNNALGRDCHGRRKKLELSLHSGGLNGLKRTLYIALAEQGIGREIIVVARRGSEGESAK